MHRCAATTWASMPARSLQTPQITEASKWRSREEDLSLSIARVEAARLAKHVLALDEQLTANENQLNDLLKVSEAAPLLEETGSVRSAPRSASLRGRMKAGSVTRQQLRAWPG